MLRNIIGPVLTLEIVIFFVVFWLVFQNSSSFCRENEIFENTKNKKNKKNKKNGPVFNFKKGKSWTSF